MGKRQTVTVWDVQSSKRDGQYDRGASYDNWLEATRQIKAELQNGREVLITSETLSREQWESRPTDADEPSNNGMWPQ